MLAIKRPWQEGIGLSQVHPQAQKHALNEDWASQMLFKHLLPGAAHVLKSFIQVCYCIQIVAMHMCNKSGCRWVWWSSQCFIFPSVFSFSACVWMRRREGGRTHNQSLMFLNCGNSILLNVFFLSEARICYFKCPSSLRSIEKCHVEKLGWATLHQLEKQMLPCGSHHQT